MALANSTGRVLDKKVLIKQEVFDSLLTHAKMCYPKESILLLRGAEAKDKIMVNEVVIPPFSVYGDVFSSFLLNTLPIDFSIIGVAHSHPSGVLQPSVEDLNNFYSRIMVITSYPYDSEKDLAVFTRDGLCSNYEIYSEK